MYERVRAVVGVGLAASVIAGAYAAGVALAPEPVDPRVERTQRPAPRPGTTAEATPPADAAVPSAVPVTPSPRIRAREGDERDRRTREPTSETPGREPGGIPRGTARPDPAEPSDPSGEPTPRPPTEPPSPTPPPTPTPPETTQPTPAPSEEPSSPEAGRA